MSIEENKTTVRRYFAEFWNAGNLAVADELLHPNYISADVQTAGEQSIAASKAGNTLWHRILPDIHFMLDEIIAEGDTVVARWTAHGVHKGEWETPIGNVPATGKATITPGTSSYHLKDGKILSDVNHIDTFSMLQQMGAVVQMKSH